MKKRLERVISSLLAVLMLVMFICGCQKSGNGGDDTTVGTTPEITVPPTTSTDTQNPPEVSGSEAELKTGIFTWLSNAYTKNDTREYMPKERPVSTTVHMAKNETEGVHVSFTSEKRKNGLSFKVNNEYEGITVELFREYAVPANGEDHPDALAPFNGTVRFSNNEVRSLLVNFKTTAETKAGDYEYELQLLDKDEVLHTYNVTVRVYEITYPEKPTLETAFGIELRSIAFSHGIIDSLPNPYVPTEEEFEAIEEIYLKYYEYMLDHKIAPMQLPYDILDPRADKYMSDPRQTTFNVPSNVDDETLAAIYAKLKSNPEWLEKAYIYPVDEPTNKAHLDTMIEQYERYQRICPDIKMATSFFVNVNYDSSKDQLQVMGEILDILCSKISNWNEKEIGWGLGIGKHPTLGTFAERMHKLKAEGKTIWSYVCWEPQDPYLNLLLTDDGLDYRLLFWQQYSLGTTGFLYWSVNCYGHCRDPWSTQVSWLSEKIHGDGILIYPGSKLNIDGPVGSIRFEACRDGVEDNEILTLAEELLGYDYVSDKIGKLITDIVTYTESEELFESVRAEIMADVEKALKNK